MQLAIYDESNCYLNQLVKILIEFIIVMMMMIIKIRKYTENLSDYTPSPGIPKVKPM